MRRSLPLCLALWLLGALWAAPADAASQTVRHALRLDGRPWLFICCLAALRVVAPALLMAVVGFTLFGR